MQKATAQPHGVVVEFPLTAEITERLYYLELARHPNAIKPRIDRRLMRAYWRTHPIEFPPWPQENEQ